MMKLRMATAALLFSSALTLFAQAQNPIIHADVPDLSMLRVGDTYYMTSTTMHMAPGVPIMKSKDLVNWSIINYAYDTLADVPAMNLDKGQSTYGKGSWASSIRLHNGRYYISTFAQTTDKTYIFSTDNLETGKWTRHEFAPAYHDHSLFFDDGRAYLINGSGKIYITELNKDLTDVIPGSRRVLIENANAPIKGEIMLPAEGSQLFKVNGKYYLFNIGWPKGGMRTVVVHRADKLMGPYEGRVALTDRGIAQGGLIDTPAGKWYAYLFEDCGAVGRIPHWVPVEWKEGWPVLGNEGKAPLVLNELPASSGLIPGIVNSDEFSREAGERAWPLVWQWNHNPDNSLWSLNARKGYLRLTNGRVENNLLQAKNTLTQRTVGPVSSGTISLDASGMKEGDFAGLTLLQKEYGQVGVKVEKGQRYIVMVSGEKDAPVEVERVPCGAKVLYFKAECDFRNRADKGYFYYSLDGKKWIPVGQSIQMRYTIPHFMGYRFGLFSYATKMVGGYADFDYFHISTEAIQCKEKN